MLVPALIALAALVPVARAGSGPWVVSEGDLSLYGGTEYQRFTKLATADGSSVGDLVDVDDGVETFGLKAVASYGLRERVELELDVPWARAEANTTDGDVCTGLGLSACATTQGLGILGTRVKGLVLDELYGSPVSLAVGGQVRFGAFTSDERARITNLGEGTTDLGVFTSVGRAGGLGEGFWSAWAEGGWRHRFPNTQLRGVAVPGDEVTADLELLAGTRRWWSVGPAVSYLQRYQGEDFERIQLADVDRFGSLRLTTVRAGGKLILRSSERVSFVASALGTLYAVNNPADVLSLGLGLGVQPRARE